MFRLLLVLGCVGLFATLAVCQKPVSNTPPPALPTAPVLTEADVAKLLGKPIKWIKHYHMLLDQMLSVDVWLGADDKKCAGYLTYNSSKLRFRLDGTLEGTVLKLQELNARDEVTGYLQADWNEAILKGTWENVDHTVSMPFLMRPFIKGAPPPITTCGDQKWTARYGANFKNKPADLLLTRHDDHTLTGTLWSDAGSLTYTLKGQLQPDGQCRLDAFLPEGKIIGSFVGKLLPQQPFEASWNSEGATAMSVRWIFRESMTYGCFEFADHISTLDALYPQSKYTSLNDWFRVQLEAWRSRTKATMAKQPQNTPVPAHRAALRSHAYSEMVCWTDALLSGLFICRDSWSSTPFEMAFNLDPKTGKMVTFADIFEKESQALSWLQSYLSKEKAKLPRFGTDVAFREWVFKEKFELWTLQRDGMAFYSNFHPIYGHAKIAVPYATLKPLLRKEGLPSLWVK